MIGTFIFSTTCTAKSHALINWCVSSSPEQYGSNLITSSNFIYYINIICCTFNFQEVVDYLEDISINDTMYEFHADSLLKTMNTFKFVCIF